MTNLIEVDLNAITNNLRVIKKLIYPETKIIGVVKANAYGHGLIETSRAIWTSGADILACATLEEAIALRVAKIKAPILVLGYVDPSEFRKVIDFDITISAYDFEVAFNLSREAKKQNLWGKVDVVFDTGMNRYGFPVYDALANYQKIASLEHIKIEGIRSHFADCSDSDFSALQMQQMQNILFAFQQNRITPPMAHMASTKGVFLYPEAQFNAVRVGFGIYGYCDIDHKTEELMPALELKSVIAVIRRVGDKESVGYDRTYIAKGPKKIAVVPIGYADGYARDFSNKSEVLIDGKRAKVVGVVSMNAIMVDVTGIQCRVGDEVVLIGKQGNDTVYADELAEIIKTNPREILSRLSPLIPREFHFK
ncbi:MAG: alanine racemase [Candidatus Berkelbacteria bacterium]|nr:alanine racemase [Candidatus Berkelbacteria bacterium]